jgi:signal transduction histidine kinase/ActR/RegA family two-component response regulator
VSLPKDTALDAGGGRRPIEDSAAPIIDDSGNLLGAVLVFRDVSERRELEHQLALADRLSSLGTLAASIAHEINNPLAYILANAAFVTRELGRLKDRLHAPEPPLPDFITTVDGAIEAANELQLGSERVRQIVADLKAFGRPERGESSLVRVEAVMQWALRITEPEIVRHGRLTTSLGAVPAVLGSETRLGQVFINLLTNAAHALEHSSATDRLVAVSTETDAEGWAVIAIRDTGSGIAAASMPQLFEPFFTTKAVGHGSGLGLAVCHGIVKALGGEISVASQVGEGSTFRVRLPPAPDPQTQTPASTRGGVALRGRLLVVDDEPLLLSAMERMLKLHHDVVVSSSAERALHLMQKGDEFDLVLYDLTMPGLTAMDFYERVLQHRPALAERIVFVSGGAFTARAQEFLRSVRNARLHKPFNPDQLLEFVQVFLRQRARQSDGST